jgi:cyclic pyranopterin phosphate synthase
MADDARQALALRISVTDRCPFRCVYCMPGGGVPLAPREQVLTFEDILRFVRVVKRHFGLAKVRLTGGDPLCRHGILDLVRMLADEGVGALTMTTNAVLLAPVAAALRDAGLGRVNVSLDSLDPETFSRLTRGGDLGRVLEGIEAALAAGLTPVKLNAVVIRGWNDGEIVTLARWAFERDCAIRFLELMPIGCAEPLSRERFVSTDEVRGRLAEHFRLEPLAGDPTQSSRDFAASDDAGLAGTVGFIASETQPFCEACNRLRLTSTGWLIPCLARGGGRVVRDLLRDPDAEDSLVRAIAGGLAGKRTREDFDTEHAMRSVGG